MDIRPVVAILAVSLVACAPREPARVQPHPVAAPLLLAPLENLSDDPRAPGIVETLLDGALRSQEVPVAGSLQGAFARGHVTTLREIQVAASRRGAAFVLMGRITQFERRPEPREGEISVVTVEMRLLDVASGRVVWERGFSRTSQPVANPGGEGLGTVSNALVNEVARALSPGAPR